MLRGTFCDSDSIIDYFRQGGCCPAETMRFIGDLFGNFVHHGFRHFQYLLCSVDWREIHDRGRANLQSKVCATLATDSMQIACRLVPSPISGSRSYSCSCSSFTAYANAAAENSTNAAPSHSTCCAFPIPIEVNRSQSICQVIGFAIATVLNHFGSGSSG
jgi:hypothetical protein